MTTFLMNTPINHLLGYGIACLLLTILAIAFVKIYLLEFKIKLINQSSLTNEVKQSKLRIVDFQKMNLCFSFDLDQNYNFKDKFVKEEYKDYTPTEVQTGLSFMKTMTC